VLACSFAALEAQNFSVSLQVLSPVSCYSGDDGSLKAVVLPPGGGSYTYAWSSGHSTDVATGLPAGAYSVTVQNSAGGSAVATAVLNEPALLEAISLTELPLPVNPTGTVEVETSGGTEPYAFQWRNAANIPVANTEDLIEAPAGTYTLNVTDANGCTAVLSPVVLVFTSSAGMLSDEAYRAYPNPVSTVLTLEWPGDETMAVQVFNQQGQLVSAHMLTGPKASLSTADWPSGVYTICLPARQKSIRVLRNN
jgi:hypothetical protein